MRKLFLISVTALIAASPSQAKSLKWMDASGAGLPKGSQMAVLSGDPGKAGDFKVRSRCRPVTPFRRITIRPTRSFGCARGALNYGMGDKLDKANAAALTDPRAPRHDGGQHEPLGVHHRWRAGRGNGMGPFPIAYVDPKDDPRGRSRSRRCGGRHGSESRDVSRARPSRPAGRHSRSLRRNSAALVKSLKSRRAALLRCDVKPGRAMSSDEADETLTLARPRARSSPIFPIRSDD